MISDGHWPFMNNERLCDHTLFMRSILVAKIVLKLVVSVCQQWRVIRFARCSEGLCFLNCNQPGGVSQLPPNVFVAAEATAWIKQNVDGVKTTTQAIELMQVGWNWDSNHGLNWLSGNCSRRELGGASCFPFAENGGGKVHQSCFQSSEAQVHQWFLSVLHRRQGQNGWVNNITDRLGVKILCCVETAFEALFGVCVCVCVCVCVWVCVCVCVCVCSLGLDMSATYFMPDFFVPSFQNKIGRWIGRSTSSGVKWPFTTTRRMKTPFRPSSRSANAFGLYATVHLWQQWTQVWFNFWRQAKKLSVFW